MFALALRFMPQILVAVTLIAALSAGAVHERRLGYETRWAEDFKTELKDDMARARLADDQLWRTNLADLTEITAYFVRFNAWARYEAAAAALTAGLAGRVSDAEDRLRDLQVPGGGACGGAAGAGTASAEGLERLHQLEQRVYDTAGQCGAALETLSIKPLCECPN